MNYPIDGIYLFCGLSKSGKTVLMTYLASQMGRYFDYAIGFTQTKFRNTLSFIPQDLVYESFRSDIVEKVLEKQKKLISEGQEPKVAIFCDDVLGDSEVRLYGKLWTKLASSCRHYGVTIFLATQYVFAVPPIIRRNAFMIYITSSPTYEEVSVLFKEFGRRVDRKTFEKIIDQATEGFSCLQINPRGKDEREIYKRILAPARIAPFKI